MTNARFLAEVSKRLACSLDWETTLQSVAHAALPRLADWCVVDVLDESASLQRVAAAHVDPRLQERTWEIATGHAPDATELQGVPYALREGRIELIDAPDPGDGRHLRLLRALGSSRGAIAPMLTSGPVVGALSLGSARYDDHIDLDLTEELARRCAVALENARQYRLAREAVERRDTFVATVSHDLRNPLATIRAQAQLLRRLSNVEDATGAQRFGQGLARIEATVERMSRMIDMLLDVTRLELGGGLDLNRAPMDLLAVAQRLAAEHQQRAPRHRIQVAGETSLVGHWDAARIERVLDNLIANAVKYSPDGGVVTVVCVREGDNGQGWAILSVRDPGLGIPAADIGRIFERFHRASNVAGISGSGIGLATVRDIVEQHGGTITVDSEEGQGSTFTLRLPLPDPT